MKYQPGLNGILNHWSNAWSGKRSHCKNRESSATFLCVPDSVRYESAEKPAVSKRNYLFEGDNVTVTYPGPEFLMGQLQMYWYALGNRKSERCRSTHCALRTRRPAGSSNFSYKTSSESLNEFVSSESSTHHG